MRVFLAMVFTVLMQPGDAGAQLFSTPIPPASPRNIEECQNWSERERRSVEAAYQPRLRAIRGRDCTVGRSDWLQCGNDKWREHARLSDDMYERLRQVSAGYRLCADRYHASQRDRRGVSILEGIADRATEGLISGYRGDVISKANAAADTVELANRMRRKLMRQDRRLPLLKGLYPAKNFSEILRRVRKAGSFARSAQERAIADFQVSHAEFEKATRLQSRTAARLDSNWSRIDRAVASIQEGGTTGNRAGLSNGDEIVMTLRQMREVQARAVAEERASRGAESQRAMAAAAERRRAAAAAERRRAAAAAAAERQRAAEAAAARRAAEQRRAAAARARALQRTQTPVSRAPRYVPPVRTYVPPPVRTGPPMHQQIMEQLIRGLSGGRQPTFGIPRSNSNCVDSPGYGPKCETR
jgi:hypothetical protein